MALIVEIGDIVANANSYNDRAEIIAFAGLRGVILADDDTTDVMAVKAVDFLEMFRDRYIGREVQPFVQSLAWPREGATIGAAVVGSDTIPTRIKQAQMFLVIEVNSGVDLTPTTGAGTSSGGFVTHEKLGPIETDYSEAIELAKGLSPNMPHIMAMLDPYLRAFGGPTTSYRK